MIRKILAAFGCPWFLESKGMGQDQIKRRLASIRTQRLEIYGKIIDARKSKKKVSHLYAEMGAATKEKLRLEGMLK